MRLPSITMRPPSTTSSSFAPAIVISRPPSSTSVPSGFTRSTVTVIFIVAGAQKLFNYAGTQQYMESAGLPGILLMLWGGASADRSDPRLLIILGTVVSGVAVFAMPYAKGFVMILALNIVMGAANGISMPAGFRMFMCRLPC